LKRRTFIAQGSLLATGLHFSKLLPTSFTDIPATTSLYSIFKDPNVVYWPYVRWWWNGDKIEKQELSRELRLLKDAGIGGIEINPIKFPARTNDTDKQSVQWLSSEWIELLKFAFDEARSLGMTCDLIVGSGWPFGAEWLGDDERSQVIVIGTKKLDGPLDYEASLFDLFKEADPPISSPFAGRKMEMLSVKLVPQTINDIEQATDLSDQITTGTIKYKIPAGKHVLYALVKINGFMEVIQGAPGATGPVLNHSDAVADKKSVNRMSRYNKRSDRSHLISVHYFRIAWNWKEPIGAMTCRNSFKKEGDMISCHTCHLFCSGLAGWAIAGAMIMTRRMAPSLTK
jgi:hypothetical protein